jgi:hypothetical protein
MMTTIKNQLYVTKGIRLTLSDTTLYVKSFLREPTIDDLITRKEKIWRQLNDFALGHTDEMDLYEMHSLWSERTMIDSELYERRMFGELTRIEGEKSIFLCHCSNDKGIVRMVNDDLGRLGIIHGLMKISFESEIPSWGKSLMGFAPRR